MKKLLLASLILYLSAFPVSAITYYCDPAIGKMSNPGTSAQPWSKLEDVFNNNKTFQPGDYILLRNGYHGFPSVKGLNTGYVTIQPDSGQSPSVKKLIVTSASRWIISGLTISPEVVNSYEQGNFVRFNSSANYITLQNCSIYSTLNSNGWTQSDWENKMGDAILCDGTNCLITNNTIKNIDFGISIAGDYSVASYNTIESIGGDALRGNANFCKFEYNIVKNFYVANENHDDIFQSWTTDANGTVGAGTITGVELRGNIFISHTDLNQALPTEPQGIGCFDGMYVNWIIENNLIVVEHWHGISLHGATNCKIINNTVVENPLNFDNSGMAPWIRIIDGNKKSTGNIIRNNFTHSMASDNSIGVVDYNIVSTNYANYFVNPLALNFHLKPGSAAINAGSNVDAPVIDQEKNTRIIPYDVGCFEFNGMANQVYTSILLIPTSVSVLVNTTQQFTATALDQNTIPMSTQPAFNFTVTGGGTINASSGLFTAGSTPGGPYTVTVTSGGKTATASVTVIAQPACVALGNMTEGTTTDNISDASGTYINATRFQASSSFSSSTIQAKVNGITGKYKCAIYADNAGVPGALLKQSTEVTNPTSGWKSFTLQSAQNITGGSYYWLAIWCDQKSTSAGIYTNTTGGETRWTAATTYGTWPTTLNTIGGSAYNYSIYAECGVTTSVADDRQTNYTIYPNPANTQLTIRTDISQTQNSRVKIYDMLGKEIANESIEGFEKSVNISAIPNGIYLLKLETPANTVMRKFVVQH